MSEEQRQQDAAAKAAEYRARFAAQADDPAPAAPPAADPAPEVPARPEWVPEKFYNAETGEVDYEAFGKSHKELERLFHESRQEAPKEGDAPAEGDSPETPKEGEVPAGLMERPSVKAAQEAFAETQELSDEHYAALEADGIPRQMVDAYIAGQMAKANAIADAAYKAAGGEEQYAEMQAWAAEALTPAQKRAYNAQLDTNDPEVIAAATANLFAQYKANANIDGERVGGGAPKNDSSTFASRTEMAAAINKIDERTGKRLYDVDPAYRAEVMRKIGNTRRVGGVL